MRLELAQELLKGPSVGRESLFLQFLLLLEDALEPLLGFPEELFLQNVLVVFVLSKDNTHLANVDFVVFAEVLQRLFVDLAEVLGPDLQKGLDFPVDRELVQFGVPVNLVNLLSCLRDTQRNPLVQSFPECKPCRGYGRTW